MSKHLSAGDHTINLDINGVERFYLLHIPPNLPNVNVRSIVVLHGTGGTAKWAQEETLFDDFADANGIVAIYPQGLPPDPALPPSFIKNPAAWNASGVLLPNHKPDDLSYMSALFDDLPRHYGCDSQSIFVTGFSNGASMCFELAVHLGNRIAGIAPIAGYCRTDGPVVRPVPTMFIIGAADPMVPPLGGPVTSPWTGETKVRPPVWESLDRWAELMGNRPPRQVISNLNGVRSEHYPGANPFEVITVDGLGHHWPNGRGQLKKKLAGEPSDRIDANSLVWKFFRRYYKRRTPTL